jgi:hypothetical protein
MNQVNNRSEKSSTFFGGSNFMKLNNYLFSREVYWEKINVSEKSDFFGRK